MVAAESEENRAMRTEKTAGTHVSSLLAKLNVARRTKAAAIAIRLGMINDGGGRPVEVKPESSGSRSRYGPAVSLVPMTDPRDHRVGTVRREEPA